MSFRRAFAVAGAFVLAVSAGSPSYAQDKGKPPAAAEQQRKLSNDERDDYRAVSALVDDVISGKQPAPADVKIKFQNHFLKSSKNVYVPYMLELSGAKFSSFPVTMYVRAVEKSAAGAAPAAPAKPGVEMNWPFADVYFLNERASRPTAMSPSWVAPWSSLRGSTRSISRCASGSPRIASSSPSRSCWRNR